MTSTAEGQTVEELQQEIAAALHKVYSEAGFISDADNKLDRKRLGAAAYRVVRLAEVETLQERSTKGLTKGALTAKLFPNVKGAKLADHHDFTFVQGEVWKELVREVGKTIATDPNGPVQKLLGSSGEDEGKILVHAKVPVGEDSLKPEDVVYVTGSEKLLKLDFAQPLRQSVNRAALRLSQNMAMVQNRKPGLKSMVKREVESGLRTASDNAKTTLAALTMASENGADE